MFCENECTVLLINHECTAEYGKNDKKYTFIQTSVKDEWIVYNIFPCATLYSYHYLLVASA